MARILNKEQRSYLTDKVFEAAEKKLTPICKIDSAAVVKANNALALRAWRKLGYMSELEALKICSRHSHGYSSSGNTFSFSVTLDKKVINSVGGQLTTEVALDSWRKRTVEFTGPKSKRIAEQLVKVINQFHGELVMQNTEGFEVFLENILAQIKKIK